MDVRLLMAGEQGLVVEFGDAIDPALNDRVHAFSRDLAAARLPGVLEIVPTYRSALVVFDPLAIARDTLQAHVAALAGRLGAPAPATQKRRLIRIPVCYGGPFGPDLEFVAAHNRIAPEEVVRLHTVRPCRVYMLGFMPGFPYLGGMDERIAAPRLPRPRTKVPAGSVGIAGNQTGFYPGESPGGWRIIGRTPIRPFDPAAAAPFLFSAGDELQCVAISPAQYESIRRDVAAGRYVAEVVGPEARA